MRAALYRFGKCRLDLETRELFRDGKPRRLSPKAFEILTVLVTERPRVVSKSEILQTVWHDAFVSEVNLPVLVAEIRRALGDATRNSALLKTHHTIGYSFVGEVHELVRRPRIAMAGPRFVLAIADRRCDLAAGPNVIGRDASADIMVPHASVSRSHARLTVDRGGVVIEDLDSKNGTRVNGVRISAATVVQPGAAIEFGTIEAVLLLDEASQNSTMTVS